MYLLILSDIQIAIWSTKFSFFWTPQIHVVDGSSQQPELEFDAVHLELELFSPELAEKPYIVAYNKMDLPEAYENWSSFKERLQARGIEPFCMSAVTGEGTHEVICAAYELLQKSKETNKELEGQIFTLVLISLVYPSSCLHTQIVTYSYNILTSWYLNFIEKFLLF